MDQFPYDNQEPDYFAGNPFDPNVLYNQQAQLYYQQERESAKYQYTDPLYTDTVSEGSFMDNAYTAFGMDGHLALEDQRRYETQQRAAYRAMGDTVVEGAHAFASPFANFAIEEAGGAAGAMAGGVIGGAVGGAPGAMVGSYLGSQVGTTISTAAGEFGGAYLGFDQMARQFGRTDDLQIYSNNFMAGTTSGDFLDQRADRDTSQEINKYIEEYARYASAMGHDQVSSDDIRQEVATMSENKILENVHSAEDFARQFTTLKDGVQRITEVLGKTFEEGAEMLGQYRNLGIDPTQAMGMVENMQMMGTISGAGFDAVNAAGMQSAMQLQGTGMTAQAAVNIGARSEASSRQIYETGALGERTIYNLGGPEGISQRLQQLGGRMQNSAHMDRIMRAAYDGEGISMDRLNRIASGDLNAMNALDNFDSVNDQLQYQYESDGFYSNIMEEDPALGSALFLQSAGSMLQQSGVEFGSEEQMYQGIAEVTGMSLEEIELMFAQVRSANVGAHRERNRQLQQGSGRLNERRTLSRRVGRALTSNRVGRGLQNFGAESAEFLADTAYNTSRSIQDGLRYTLSGERRMPSTSAAFSEFLEERDIDYSGEGGYHTSHFFNLNDSVDVLKEVRRRGLVSDDDVYNIDPTLLTPNNDGSGNVDLSDISFNENQLSNIGLSDQEAARFANQNFESLTEAGREMGLHFFERGIMGSRGVDVVRADTMNQASQRMENAAQLGRGIRQSLGTEYSELSDVERELYTDVRTQFAQAFESDPGMQRDSIAGGQRIQESMYEIAERISEERGISMEDALGAVQNIGGHVLATEQYSSRLGNSVSQMGVFEGIGSGQGARLDGAQDIASSFGEAVSTGIGSLGDLTDDVMALQLGVSGEKASRVRDILRTNADGTFRADALRNPGSAEIRDQDLQRLRSEGMGDVADRLEQRMARSADLNMTDLDEEQSSIALQYGIMMNAQNKQAAARGMGTSMEELQNQVAGMGNIQEFVQFAGDMDEGQIREFIEGIDVNAEGSTNEFTTNARLREARINDISQRDPMMGSILDLLNQMVTEGNEEQSAILRDIRDNTGGYSGPNR